MAGKITLMMIKPDAFGKNYTGPIIQMITNAGFRISAMKFLILTRQQAEQFYAVHMGKPFYSRLVEFMSSGPVVAVLLEKDNAIEDFREIIGATDPAHAAPGTVRALYAEDVRRNAVHGSDSDANAVIESDFFFSALERF
jgi:nucleoside-diphosphate kinase